MNENTKNPRPLVEVTNLSKHFPLSKSLFYQKADKVRALDEVSFSIPKGETLGVVGESGCGKSTLGKTLLRLIEPTQGKITFGGIDITQLRGSEMQAMRRKMQLVFQDPYAALNPRMTIHATLSEPLIIHHLCPSKEEKRKRIHTLLDYVQLPQTVLDKYPHEFSGGQRQRICIARALAVEPEFIVCDESVSALDISIQAQVLNLLIDLQGQLGLTYLFIGHDLNVVRFISHQVAVMYLGKIVEMGPVDSVYQYPQHPYTKALLSAVPIPDPAYKKNRIILQGDVPSPIAPPTGCHFHTRCWKATAVCKEVYPSITQQGATHFFRCHHPLGQETIEG